jgi:hypothetical protein
MAGRGLARPPGDDSWEPLTPTRPCDATDRTRTVRGSSRTPGEATATAKMTNSKLLYRYLPNDTPPRKVDPPAWGRFPVPVVLGGMPYRLTPYVHAVLYITSAHQVARSGSPTHGETRIEVLRPRSFPQAVGDSDGYLIRRLRAPSGEPSRREGRSSSTTGDGRVSELIPSGPHLWQSPRRIPTAGTARYVTYIFPTCSSSSARPWLLCRLWLDPQSFPGGSSLPTMNRYPGGPAKGKGQITNRTLRARDTSRGIRRGLDVSTSLPG